MGHGGALWVMVGEGGALWGDVPREGRGSLVWVKLNILKELKLYVVSPTAFKFSPSYAYAWPISNPSLPLSLFLPWLF